MEFSWRQRGIEHHLNSPFYISSRGQAGGLLRLYTIPQISCSIVLC
jgi:hypothetical protein